MFRGNNSRGIDSSVTRHPDLWLNRLEETSSCRGEFEVYYQSMNLHSLTATTHCTAII